MTVFNFPDTSGKPTDGSFTWTAPSGVLYVWNGEAWVTQGGGSSGGGEASISVTDDLSTITDPSEGDLAYHSVEARLYVYYQDDDSQQWVDASPAGDANDGAGSSFWNRNGTTLVPANDGDSVDIGSGNIQLNADGNAKFGKATSLGNADNFNLESSANGGSLKVTGVLTGSSFASYYVSGGTGNHFTGQYDNTQNFQIDHLGNVEIGGTIGTSPNISLNADGSATFDGNVSIGTYDSGNASGQGARLGKGSVTAQRPASQANPENVATFSSLLGTDKKVQIYANGDAQFAGTVRENQTIARSVVIETEPDNPANFNAEGEYTGPTLDIKDRILNLISRLDAIEANEVIDDATDTSLLQLVASASARLDSIEARLTALEGGN
jgi:hypothetical protein